MADTDDCAGGDDNDDGDTSGSVITLALPPPPTPSLPLAITVVLLPPFVFVVIRALLGRAFANAIAYTF